MRCGPIQMFGLTILALGFAPGVTLAQDNPWLAIIPNADYAVAAPPSEPQGYVQESTQESADAELTPEEQEALRNLLSNAPAVSADAPAKQLRTPTLKQTKKFDMSRTDKSDGSSNLTLKQPLPIDWDATVGTDLGLRNAPSITNSPDPWMSGSRDQRGSGAAWASVGLVPNLATIDARVDPSNDQGRVGTTFKYTKPVGSRFSVTLQNSYSVTETFSASSATAPSDVPMMSVPAPTGLTTPQVWGSEKAAKFDYLPTGTSFGAKVANSSTDPVTHNQFIAEQKVYGPLNVTTAVTDVGQTSASKSITARFKLNW
jgi:hypothetical protein